MKRLFTIIFAGLLLAACHNGQRAEQKSTRLEADSLMAAYHYSDSLFAACGRIDTAAFGDFISRAQAFAEAHPQDTLAPDMLYRLPMVATCPRGGIVLDPYCGTGTSCRIAYELNRRSIGIDINGKYINQARASIEQKPLSLF
jgi:SAM-dependent methyltransferase